MRRFLGEGKQLPPFKRGSGIIFGTSAISLAVTSVSCPCVDGERGRTRRVSWVELQPGITILSTRTPGLIACVTTIDHTSTLQYNQPSRGSSSVNCRNTDYTGRPSTATSTDSESTPKNPQNPVRNRTDFRPDPDFPPAESRVSSMNVLRQIAITLQVWPIHTQLAHTAV
jgi:hypothetical protein